MRCLNGLLWIVFIWICNTISALRKPEMTRAKISAMSAMGENLERERRELIDRTNKNVQFTLTEVMSITQSFQNIAQFNKDIDYTLLQDFILKYAHLSHKQWEVTDEAARTLSKIISGPSNQGFQAMFSRVLGDGGWDRARSSAFAREKYNKPWVGAVLR